MASRLLQNLFGAWFLRRRAFPAPVLDAIATAIGEGERMHLGEVCFAVQSRIGIDDLLRGVDAPRQAARVFERLRVWDTQHNTGVLVHVLLAEHRIEILADRGIAACVPQAEWEAICAGMRERFAAGAWRDGALDGIAAMHALLRRHFPSDGRPNPDELGNRPRLL
jgi:uncharacterized membrane protein